MQKFILLICTLFFLSSCKTTSSIFQESQTSTTQQLSLGSIGLDKDFILQSNFNSAATPSYQEPVKVSVFKVPFTKATYNAFTKAKTLQTANVNITYIDSLPVKPNFIKLQIADKVSVINALNSEHNTNVKTYLQHNKTANMITSISLALNKEDLDNITSADAAFLIEKQPKIYALQLYKEAEKVQLIWFNKGIIFEYKTSNCCWQAIRKNDLDIVDLVDPYSNCPNKTFRSANRANNKVKSDYKF